MNMALKRVDEFDGVSEAEVVEFSVDGVSYEIDLSADNKAKLHEVLERFISAGRRKAPRAPRPARSGKNPAPARTEQLEAIRSWARKKGHKVSDRGRIPKEVMHQFDAEHSPPIFSEV